jgi:glycosyltransferase involved in cell wall biosynthesis
MIVRDESMRLYSFLSPIKSLLDEIIIVDTGSKDNTKKIAGTFTKKVFSFPWCHDFSKARNFSIKLATKDWVLVLDPDEKISETDIINLRKMLSKADKQILGYRLIQKSYYRNKVISIRGICRAFKNDGRIRFIYPIHETVRESIKSLGGRVAKTGIVINHYPKMGQKKQSQYLELLKIKKKRFPHSNVDREIKNELSLIFTDLLRPSLRDKHIGNLNG